VGAGDDVRSSRDRGTISPSGTLFRIYTRDRDESTAACVPRMSESWRRWAQEFLQKTKGRSGVRPNPDAARPRINATYERHVRP